MSVSRLSDIYPFMKLYHAAELTIRKSTHIISPLFSIRLFYLDFFHIHIRIKTKPQVILF